MHSEIAILIDAPPSLVFALAREVGRWERLLPHYARSRVVARPGEGVAVVDFVARRVFVPVLGFGIPVTWRSRTWSDPAALRLRFVHVAGATRGMDVTWRIESAGGASDGASSGPTVVTIEHEFAPRMPGFARFVDLVFTRPIAGRTLATFKALAEAIAADPTLTARHASSDATPTRSGATNTAYPST